MGDVMKKIQLSLEQICYVSKEFRWKSGGEGFIIRIPYKESYIILKILMIGILKLFICLRVKLIKKNSYCKMN